MYNPVFEVIFFKELGKHLKGDTIKLQFDKRNGTDSFMQELEKSCGFSE